MLPIILVAESSGFSKRAVECLQRFARLVLADLGRDSLLSSVREADILWVRLRNRIDREVMEAAPRLRAIATPTTGLNHIDLAEARRRNVQVISLNGAGEFLQNVYATAEHTVALILGLLRLLPAAHEHVIQGDWNRDLFIGRELHGKTAGVVGYGRVGRMVAGYLHAFGMRVLVADIEAAYEVSQVGIEPVSLIQLLEDSDVVTLHVPLTDRTRRFFGQDEFARMKAGSWFINTARGELVNENALLDALQGGRMAGVALDVLPDERSSGMGGDPIVQYASHHNNVLITPHIGGCTSESRDKTEEFIASRVIDFLRATNGHAPNGLDKVQRPLELWQSGR